MSDQIDVSKVLLELTKSAPTLLQTLLNQVSGVYKWVWTPTETTMAPYSLTKAVSKEDLLSTLVDKFGGDKNKLTVKIDLGDTVTHDLRIGHRTYLNFMGRYPGTEGVFGWDVKFPIQILVTPAVCTPTYDNNAQTAVKFISSIKVQKGVGDFYTFCKSKVGVSFSAEPVIKTGNVNHLITVSMDTITGWAMPDGTPWSDQVTIEADGSMTGPVSGVNMGKRA